MRIYLFVLSFCLAVLSSCNTQRPDILLINIDDMGWRDVGFMGSEFYETPVLDGLASEGMIFTQAYASASNCAPSRACMMSGQWTPRHGIYTVSNSDRGKSKTRKLVPTPNISELADDQYILTEAMRDAGYICCHAGKWHLGEDPLSQGFHFNIGGSEAGNPGSYYPPYKRVAMKAPDSLYYLTNLIMDQTIKFVEKADRDKPIFLYYSPYAVHTPIQPVKNLLPKYKNKLAWNGQNNYAYATMVENLDSQIGRLIEALKKNDRFDNTFIFFISDNGGLYKVTKQRPLRAGKGSYYEGGIREPAFVYWPGKIKAGILNQEPITNLDIYPTILEVAGIENRSDKILDGNSVVPLFNGDGFDKDRALFWHFPIYLEGGNKESQDPVFRTRPGSAVRRGDWKLIEYFENGELELYNLKDDVGEVNNLAEERPEKLEEMKRLLIDWREETSAPVPTELNPEYLFIKEK